MSQVTPPGWYPDAEDGTRLRYWDGTAWTDARTALAPAPVGIAQPDLPESTQVNTVFAWIFAFLPVVSVVVSLLQVGSLQAQVAQISVSNSGTFTNATVPGFNAASLLGNLLSLVLYAAAVVLALFDWRALTRIGIVKPFHWAFAFIPVQLVYMIGRTVVLRRRVHRGQAPLIAHIIVIVVSWIVVIVLVVTVLIAVFAQIGTSGAFTGTSA